MESNPLIRFTLLDLYRIVFRHSRKILAFAAVMASLVGVALISAPKKFVSEARLLVNVGLESLNADPTTNGTPSVSLQVAREEEVKSILDLFHSHAIASEVADQLGPETVLQKRGDEKPSTLGQIKSQIGALIGSVKVSDRERAVRKIRKMITVGSAAKSNVIQVTAEAETPELAQQVVAAYVRIARQKHSTAHETENSTAFLRAKLTSVNEEFLSAGKRLRDFKNSMGVVSIEGRKRTLEEQIRQLQTNVVDAESEVASFDDKIEQIRQRMPELRIADFRDSSTSVSSQSLDTMRAELYELRVETQGLASRLTSNHPIYRNALQQVKKAAADLEREELRYAFSNVARLNARIAAYEDELDAKRQQLQQLNEDEVVLKSLQSEVDLLEKRYERYNADLANAQIIEDRRSHEITNINVFQPASKIETPVSPNRSLLAALGAAAALFGSFAIAFGSEFLDSSLKTPEEIEANLDLPVLESIPESNATISRRRD